MKSVGWATLLSLSVHGALGWAVMRAPVGWFGEAEPYEPIAIEIITPPDPIMPPSEEVEEELAPPAPVPEDALPEDAVAALIEPQMGIPNPDQTGEPVDGVMPEAALPSSIDVPDVTPEEPQPNQPRDPRAMQALLNPANVARGGYVPTGPGPTRRGPPAGLASGGNERPSEADIERQHRDHLRGAAMARPWLTRERPEVQRQPDGSYAYEGHRFRAHIRPDGSVEFEDHGNAQTNGFSASGSFDLTDAIMGASGQDPHAAERDWFMRNTRELRHRLEAEHRVEENTRGLGRLRGRLARVWRTRSRTTGARRRRIFSIWDEMADDATGRRGREVVYAFIRDTIPEGSEDAYTGAELSRLNASRESTARFDPY